MCDLSLEMCVWTGVPSVILIEKRSSGRVPAHTVESAALPASQAVGKTVRTTFCRPSAPHGVACYNSKNDLPAEA